MNSNSPQPATGRQTPHESAAGHVTGTARYVDDLPEPLGTLHLATGLSTVAHGRLAAVALDEVRSAPGVVDVFVAGDVPGDLDVGAVFPGDPLLASGQVEFIGQPVFAVAAENRDDALRAVARAHIAYEPLPALLTVDDALAADAFVLPSRTWGKGDAEAALATAAHRVDGDLYVRGQEHFYLEPQAAFALPLGDGGVLVHASTQHPGEVQKLVAGVLGVPMHQVQVECRRMGGGFGGKESQAAPLACLAALAAVRTGRPVKYRMPRRDDMVQTGKRHDFHCAYAFGFEPDGQLTAARVTFAAKCGYSPDLSEGIVDRAMFHATNAYFVPHVTTTGHRCKTHTVSNTAFRGFGGPQGILMMEAAMDELAHALAMDPLDVRLRNLFGPQRALTHYGQTVEQFVLPALMTQLERESEYRKRRTELRAFNAAHTTRKKGIALTPVQFGISFTTTHLNQAGALVHVYTDGSVEVNHAGTEMGQGLYTKIRQVVADAFGLPLERVANSATRTDKVPNGSPTAASAGTDLNALAALDACDKIKAALTAFAHGELNWPQEPLRFEGGAVGAGSQRMPFVDFVVAAHKGRTPLSSSGFYATPDIHFDKVRGHGHPFYYYANGAAVSEVVVDTLTGAYRVTRVDILHDVGASLNPAVDIGQIEGGYVQGLGWLTTEELLWNEEGAVIANSPANYKIPAVDNCPEHFEVKLFDRENHKPAVGRSKAVGEPPLMLAISAWCALRDACSAVSDYRVLPKLAVPATPEAVFWALQAARDAQP